MSDKIKSVESTIPYAEAASLRTFLVDNLMFSCGQNHLLLVEVIRFIKQLAFMKLDFYRAKILPTIAKRVVVYSHQLFSHCGQP